MDERKVLFFSNNLEEIKNVIISILKENVF